MKKLILLIPAVAGTLALATVAPAAAESCTPPKYSGFHISSLTAHNITCHAASENVKHFLRSGPPSGYTCSTRLVGTRGTSISCHHGDHSFHASWRAD